MRTQLDLNHMFQWPVVPICNQQNAATATANHATCCLVGAPCYLQVTNIPYDLRGRQVAEAAEHCLVCAQQQLSC